MLNKITKIVLIIAVAMASIFWHVPTVQALDNRSIKLAKFFMKYKSPLAQYSQTFVAEADKNGLDYRLLPAISGVESTFAQNYIYGSNNAYGWGGGEIYFKSWEEGIAEINRDLKQKYVDRGATNISKIGYIYCPPTAPIWSSKVQYFMDEISQTDISSVGLKLSPELPLTI